MAEKKLAGRRVLMVVAPDQFRDEELLEPKKIFEAEGAEVVVASTAAGEAKGMLGARVKPDKQLNEVNAADFDAVTVVGGMGSPEHLWDNSTLHGILRDMNEANKVVSAICLSGAALARAGVLEDRAATVWPMPESLKALADGRARYEEKPVVQDGRIITANGPEAAREFGQAIVKELSRAAASV
ncbi:MAG TPA: DJ-1/PfpI family protein [Candidatus Obscuribacterales bacterium]